MRDTCLPSWWHAAWHRAGRDTAAGGDAALVSVPTDSDRLGQLVTAPGRRSAGTAAEALPSSAAGAPPARRP